MLNWYHFWFIGFLFLYSLIAIPILIFLRSPRSERFKSGTLGVLLHPIGILLIPTAIILTTQILFRRGLTGPFEGFGFFTFYFCFFIFGVVCYSHSKIRDSIAEKSKVFVVGFIIDPWYTVCGFLIQE